MTTSSELRSRRFLPATKHTLKSYDMQASVLAFRIQNLDMNVLLGRYNLEGNGPSDLLNPCSITCNHPLAKSCPKSRGCAARMTPVERGYKYCTLCSIPKSANSGPVVFALLFCT
jgi:hypothetical protein